MLPFVLWMCGLLALAASIFLVSSRTEDTLVRTDMSIARARAAADGGVALALLGALAPGADHVWPRDGRVVRSQLGGTALLISVQDELGLLDATQAAPSLLASLFRGLGADEGAAEALAQVIVQGRERAARNSRPIADVEDLFALPGADRSLLRRAVPFLTVRNGTAAIDPVTAPAPVLRSLPGMSPWDVDRMVVAREAAILLPNTAPLLNDSDGQGPPLHRFVRIRSEGVLTSGTHADQAVQVEVELQPDARTAFRVLAWRDGSEPGW